MSVWGRGLTRNTRLVVAWSVATMAAKPDGEKASQVWFRDGRTFKGQKVASKFPIETVF